MEPLFEAKARYANDYAIYNIYRLGPETYKAKLSIDEKGNYDADAPMELVLTKKDGDWQTEDAEYYALGCTLGIEIDAFNNGYGALLGRIGVD